MLKGFRDFILRGNVIELGVAVIIAAAFGAVVSALVKDLLTPLIAAIGGKPDFSALSFSINNSRFAYGDFLNNVISFLIVAAVLYFFVIAPMNHLMERRKTAEPVGPLTRECPECLSKVPAQARRCAFCTAEIGTAAPGTTAAAAPAAGGGLLGSARALGNRAADRARRGGRIGEKIDEKVADTEVEFAPPREDGPAE